MIELNNSKPKISPAVAYEELADLATNYKIDSFDMYGDNDKDSGSSILRSFERAVALLFGKDDALFVPSGVMAQQIALMIHQKSHMHDDVRIDSASFLCHYTSHLLIHEHDSYSKLLDMKATVITSKDVNGKIQYPMSYQDVYGKLFGGDRIHDHHHIDNYEGDNTEAHDLTTDTGDDDRKDSPRFEATRLPSTVILECPHREIGGKNTTFGDLQLISNLCRDNGIALHMDGARIWEAAVYYNNDDNYACHGINEEIAADHVVGDIRVEPTEEETMHETILRVASLFDSIYVSTYKGLGAMTGSLLVGSREFIQEARIWLRRFGGNLFTLSPYVLSSLDGFEKYCLWNDIDLRSSSHYQHYHALNRNHPPQDLHHHHHDDHLHRHHEYSMKARLIRLQQVAVIVSALTIDNSSKRKLIRFDPSIPQVPLVHVYIAAPMDKAYAAHQVSSHSCGISCFSKLRSGLYGANQECYFEFNMGLANIHIDDNVWIEGWTAFLKELGDC